MYSAGDIVVTTSASTSLSISFAHLLHAFKYGRDGCAYTYMHTQVWAYTRTSLCAHLYLVYVCVCSTGVQRSLSLFSPGCTFASTRMCCIRMYVRAGIGVLLHFASRRKPACVAMCVARRCVPHAGAQIWHIAFSLPSFPTAS